MGELIAAHRPDLVVIACNTASTLVLPDLRKQFSLPFVGTVPAIKPACAASVTQARLRARHRGDGGARIYPRADPRLRAALRGHAGRLAAACRLCRGRAGTARRSPTPPSRRDRALLSSMTAAAHRHGRARLHALSAADRPASSSLRHGRCDFIDPAPAIARRVVDLLGPGTAGAAAGTGPRHFHLRPRQPPAFARARRFGIAARRRSTERGLTLRRFAPKYRRTSRAQLKLGPRGVSRPAVCCRRFRRKTCRFRPPPGAEQEEGAILTDDPEKWSSGSDQIMPH